MNRWWLKIGRYALPEGRSLLAIGILMLLGIGLGLLTPWPLKLIVDYVLANKPLPDGLTWLESLPGSEFTEDHAGLAGRRHSGLFLIADVVAIAQRYVETGAGSRMVYASSLGSLRPFAAPFTVGPLPRRNGRLNQARHCRYRLCPRVSHAGVCSERNVIANVNGHVCDNVAIESWSRDLRADAQHSVTHHHPRCCRPVFRTTLSRARIAGSRCILWPNKHYPQFRSFNHLAESTITTSIFTAWRGERFEPICVTSWPGISLR